MDYRPNGLELWLGVWYSSLVWCIMIIKCNPYYSVLLHCVSNVVLLSYFCHKKLTLTPLCANVAGNWFTVDVVLCVIVYVFEYFVTLVFGYWMHASRNSLRNNWLSRTSMNALSIKNWRTPLNRCRADTVCVLTRRQYFSVLNDIMSPS